jgi:hypothetical protein
MGATLPRWYPGRGSAIWAPPVRIFYSSRVRASLGWWRDNDASAAILRCLSAGVKLTFTSAPPSPLRTSPLLIEPKDVEFALEDLAKGDRLGAYQPLVSGGSDYLARSRVHTQPGGKRRIILNFRHVNAACKKQSCRYEGIRDLSTLLRPGDWLLSLDLSAAFWHVPLHASAAKYLSFHFALPRFYIDTDGTRRSTPAPSGSYIVDDYIVVERSAAALPFGWTSSPFVFTKVVKVLARAMRARGIRCLWFLDDCLVSLPTRAQAIRARAVIEEMLASAGFAKAPDKGVWEPTQQLPDHLGYTISTQGRGELRVPQRRCTSISSAAKDLLCRAKRDARRVPTELLQTFIGRAASVTQAVRQARFWIRSLHDVCELFAATSTLDRAALRDLQTWADFHVDSPANGVPLWPEEPSAAIYTDASGTIGFGSVLEAPRAARSAHGYLFQRPNLPGSFATDAAGGGRQGVKFSGGFWSPEERLLYHITLKELIAVRRGLLMHADDLRGRVVRLWEDNMAVVHIIQNCTSRSPALMAELRLLLTLLDELQIDLRPRYIRSALNPADFYSRMVQRDAWSLRPAVQRMVATKARRVHGQGISLDPFACHQFAVCARYASLLSDPAALSADGLALSWTHERGSVWLNPPWALLAQCIAKLHSERPAAVLIVPEWQTQVWWPALLALGGRHLRLPPPKFSVQAHHGRKVEPFLNASVQLLAVILERA